MSKSWYIGVAGQKIKWTLRSQVAGGIGEEREKYNVSTRSMAGYSMQWWVTKFYLWETNLKKWKKKEAR